MSDPVNHPAHYTSGPKHSACGDPIECIDIVESLPFNLGNAIKYLWRAGKKGDALEDYRKAIWYLHRELDRLNKAEQVPKVDQGEKVRWSEN
jgi:hypothetical protein